MNINKIIIVGGGSAGWMTAATLIKFFPQKQITVIESPDTPGIGVGESTILQITEWLRSLDIKEEDFMRHTDASYKLSIKFTDFYLKGESFHYPFGAPNFENNLAGFNDWWFKKFFRPDTPYSDFANCMFPQMAYVNNNTYSKKIPAAYHFEAIKFGIWLRDYYCIPRGVKYLKEHVKEISLNKNGISKLNNNHSADLFIDCSGFKSLLINKLEVPFENLNKLLPNNSAWATQIPYKNKKKELVSYTNCTAYKNGWIWNIPLWSRIGTGYVYSDKFVSDEDALKEFKKFLGNKDLNFKKIKMRTGVYKKIWHKNVCAIGLAAGFIEPLESNGLYSVHEFLHILVRNLQREKVSQFDKDNFNFNCKTRFYDFAEFVAMHYALSHRTDTKYWKTIFNKNWSNEIIEHIPTLKKGFLDIISKRSFDYQIHNWGHACISAGMHWGSTDIPTILKYNSKSLKLFKDDWEIVNSLLNQKKLKWNQEAKKAPSLYKILNEYHK